MGLLIHKFDGHAGSGINAAVFGIVALYSTRNVFSNTCVKRLVTAFNDINVPHISYSLLAPRRAPHFVRRLLEAILSKRKPLYPFSIERFSRVEGWGG